MPRLSKLCGEWDIKLRSREISFTKSFRFKIIMYSLASLFLTALTELVGIFVLYELGIFSRYLRKDSLNNARNYMPDVSSNMGSAFNNSLNGSIGSSLLGNVHFGLNNGAFESSFGSSGHGIFGLDISIPDLIVLVCIAFLIGVALFIVYFLILSQRLYVSLAKIAAGIERMSSGDLNTRVRIEGEDEFALIGEKLNCMALDISMLMESERKNERIKNNLITNVAHDLRTPLTSVIGYLDLLVKNPDLEEEMKTRYMTIAYDKALRLQKLIEDLFSYTKVSQGEVKPKLAPLDVVKLMEQMIDEFYPFFQDAGLAYEFTTSHAAIMVMADGDMLARAFSNLLGNAVKYGKDGKNIRVRIQKNGEMVSISVINYGKVISAKDLEYIFDRFYRVEGSRSEETGGSGLGLAIAKRIVMLHEGSIKAKSDMEGTVFEVTLKAVS